MCRKKESAWFIHKKLEGIPTTYKLSGYYFWWNCLKFSIKMGVTIQMTIFNNVLHRNTIGFKFGNKFFHFFNQVQT